MTAPTSPFAPVDIPDINNVAAPSAMPPMGMPGMGTQNAGAVQGQEAQMVSEPQTVPEPVVP